MIHIKYFLRLIVNDVSPVHTFGWSLTGTATLMETLIGLSRVMSTIRRALSDFPPFFRSKKKKFENNFIIYFSLLHIYIIRGISLAFFFYILLYYKRNNLFIFFTFFFLIAVVMNLTFAHTHTHLNTNNLRVSVEKF